MLVKFSNFNDIDIATYGCVVDESDDLISAEHVIRQSAFLSRVLCTVDVLWNVQWDAW